MGNIQFFEVKNPRFARFYLSLKIHKQLREQLADLSFPIVFITPEMFLHF